MQPYGPHRVLVWTVIPLEAFHGTPGSSLPEQQILLCVKIEGAIQTIGTRCTMSSRAVHPDPAPSHLGIIPSTHCTPYWWGSGRHTVQRGVRSGKGGGMKQVGIGTG